jgi:hypothetical protein
MIVRPLWLLGVALGAGLVVAESSCGSGSCPYCDKPIATGTVTDIDLGEVSGIAASAVHDDVFYVHNDAGDESRFFAIDRAGERLATFEVGSARNDDWEDIAVAPCPSGSCIFIGDIGDNTGERTSYTIFRLAEPTALAPAQQTVAAEELVFTYEDGPHNAEVLLVHPETGVVTIVTKVTSGPAGIYELTLTDAPRVAVRVGEIEPFHGDHEFTGGAVHPDATGVLLRTETDLFYSPMEPGQTVAAAIAADSCRVRVAEETQGEAVTFLRSGTGFVTLGESVGAPVHASQCKGM